MASLNEAGHPWLQAKVDIAASTDVLAAPSATQQYRIYALNISSAAAGTVTFKHGTTAFEGARTMATGVPLNLKEFPDIRPRYVCGLGEAFNITLSGTAQTSGSIWYTLGPV